MRPWTVVGIAGVRHHRQRRGDRRRQPREDVVGLLRAERAVHADGVGARQRERRERVRRALAERRAPVGEKRHLGDDRDLGGEPPHGAHGLGRLEQAAEGLEQDEVDAGLEQHARLLLEDLAHLASVGASRTA